jgi:probable rRNA maturation factor
VSPPAVELRVEGGDWSALGDAETLARRALEAACAEIGYDAERMEVGVLLSDDSEIATLNAAYRDSAAATNVLSWPAFEIARGADGAPLARPPVGAHGPVTLLGDIALASGVVAREAAERELAMADHATHLMIHGFLHLLGYDHENAVDAEAMEQVERAALARIGVADPYG